MKIVKIIGTLDFGGIEKVFETVARNYNGNSSDLVFIVLGNGGVTTDKISSLGYNVIVLNEKINIPNFRIIYKLYKVLEELKPDVVQTCGAEANFHGILAAKLAGVKVRVAEEIGMPSHSKIAKFIFKLVYSQSSAVIAVSKTVKEYLIKNGEADEEKIHVIYNPVDLSKFKFITKNNNSFSNEYILTAICRLHPIKNLSLLIQSLPNLLLKYPNLKIWLVGEGPQRSELEKLVKRLGLNNNVVFWGYRDNPEEYLGKSKLFILPSFSEGHPVSMIESMAVGVPVLVTKIGGASEIILEEENGWLLDPFSQSDLEKKISEILMLPSDKMEKVVEKARDTVINNFSPSNYEERIKQLFTKLIYEN